MEDKMKNIKEMVKMGKNISETLILAEILSKIIDGKTGKITFGDLDTIKKWCGEERADKILNDFCKREV